MYLSVDMNFIGCGCAAHAAWDALVNGRYFP